MADDFQFPGADEPKHEPPMEGNFPADLFDDVTEPAAVHNDPVVRPPAHVRDAATPPPPPARPPASTLNPPRPAPVPGRDRSPVIPIALAFLVIGALALYAGTRKYRDTPPAPAPAPAPTASGPAVATSAPAATPSTPDAVPASPAPTDATAGEVKDLKTQVEGLTGRLKALQGKVDELPKPEPAPDLKPVHGKVEELAKSVASVTPLSEKVDKLDERIGGVEGSVKSVKDELSGLTDEVKKLTEAAAKPAAAAPAPAAASTGDADAGKALAEGADLFKSAKYKEADAVFSKLEAGGAKDARVYYYAALTHGMTTGDWQGETVKKTAARGAELEKAGSPKAGEVDAAFSDLPVNIKAWLTFFRKPAR